MIFEFCFTNYLSIKDELKLSFIDSSLKESSIDPNAFKNSQAGEAIDVEPLRLNATTAGEPVSMEASFADEDFICRYGFEVSSETVKTEWLYC